MSLKQESREIDGIMITTTQLPPMRAFPLMAKLGKILAPALGAIGDIDPESDVKELGPALASLFGQLNEVDSTNLILEIFANTSAQSEGKLSPLNTDAMVNMVFAGKFVSMLNAMRFVLEVNFADFFAGGFAKPVETQDKKRKANRLSLTKTS
jgi:hypothetical protein